MCLALMQMAFFINARSQAYVFIRNNVYKKIVFRRGQRILALLILGVVLILVWPFIKTPNFHAFLPTSRFTIPEAPELKPAKMNAKQMPKSFTIIINSTDQQLLINLREQGFPAEIQNDKIVLGPYLQVFKSQVDFAKISQMTSNAVRIVDNTFQ